MLLSINTSLPVVKAFLFRFRPTLCFLYCIFHVLFGEEKMCVMVSPGRIAPPQNCHFPCAHQTPNTMILAPTGVNMPNGFPICSAVFAGITNDDIQHSPAIHEEIDVEVNVISGRRCGLRVAITMYYQLETDVPGLCIAGMEHASV